jgi:hypothetical protein
MPLFAGSVVAAEDADVHRAKAGNPVGEIPELLSLAFYG